MSANEMCENRIIDQEEFYLNETVAQSLSQCPCPIDIFYMLDLIDIEVSEFGR